MDAAIDDAPINYAALSPVPMPKTLLLVRTFCARARTHKTKRAQHDNRQLCPPAMNNVRSVHSHGARFPGPTLRTRTNSVR